MAVSRMRRWAGRSSAAWCSPASRNYFFLLPSLPSPAAAPTRRGPRSPWEKFMTEHSPDGSDTARGRPHGRYTLFLIALPLALAIWGVVDRVTARASVAIETAAAAIPVVITLKAAQPEAAEELVLPGSVQAFAEAPIYARTSGYLERWYTDIGSRVKKGQLLAAVQAAIRELFGTVLDMGCGYKPYE